MMLKAGSEILPGDAIAIEELARRFDEPHICEVGSWLGCGSTQVLARRGPLVCVDHWRGNPNVPKHLYTPDPFATFLDNTAGLDVYPFRCPSLQAAKIFADGAFDIVFLDGDHRYHGVKADIASWLPKVAKGGLLIGHDCEMLADDACRKALAANPGGEWLAIPEAPMGGVHYGVACAVTEIFGAAANLMAAQGRQSSIWWVQC